MTPQSLALTDLHDTLRDLRRLAMRDVPALARYERITSHLDRATTALTDSDYATCQDALRMTRLMFSGLADTRARDDAMGLLRTCDVLLDELDVLEAMERPAFPRGYRRPVLTVVQGGLGL